MTRIGAVRVGIVDVGANTLRLLVAARDHGRLVALREQRVQLGLGEEIERSGEISDEKLTEAQTIARAHVRRAHKLGCDRIDVLVTSPGRQASNGTELVRRISESTGAATRILRPEEEGELAWYGVLAGLGDPSDTVAVCDVGGGSTQVVVGTVPGGPAWARSVDLGSLRLTRRSLATAPPTDGDLDAARREVESAFSELAPPLAGSAYATGGTARALRKVAGSNLDADVLSVAARALARRSRRSIVRTYAVDPARARTVLAGTLILGEVQRRLGLALEIGRGGIREGAALLALEDLAAATA
jgi:exopolyphosphatase / guanosine-5'-triphosphate,3'-diphosphate pyrophosphatase